MPKTANFSDRKWGQEIGSNAHRKTLRGTWEPSSWERKRGRTKEGPQTQPNFHPAPEKPSTEQGMLHPFRIIQQHVGITDPSVTIAV